MFSPAAKKSSASVRSNVGARREEDSPVVGVRRSIQDSPAIPNRPSTGTPAPWNSRLSVLARVPPLKRSEREAEANAVLPVYVGEFPQLVRDAQVMFLQNHASARASFFGGMDRETSLAWIIFGNRLFLWNYLSSTDSKKCVSLDLPFAISENVGTVKNSFNSKTWLVCVVNWDGNKGTAGKVVHRPSSIGVVVCNQKIGRLAFWPDIYDVRRISPVTSATFYESEAISDGMYGSGKQLQHAKLGISINSFIASAIPAVASTCIALACSSNGMLWKFLCSQSGIQCRRIDNVMLDKFSQKSKLSHSLSSEGYLQSLVWHPLIQSSDDPCRQFLLLTNHEIQCFALKFSSEVDVSKLWSHAIISNDSDFGIQKDLAGQKKVLPLDLDVDSDGKVITILIAIICQDRVTSSSYTEYSLLTMNYKSGEDIAKPTCEKILEKKAPIQVIIPKARLEDEKFLLSMRVKVGGKPSGSAIILSGDGTATVSHYWRNSTKLYQFDLPNDAGKVLDASVFPSSDGGEDGAWAVLTEKAGVWAIPEKAVLLGGVEPPERSLSRRGSLNDGSLQEERSKFPAGGNTAPRRANLESRDAGDKLTLNFSGAALRSPQDEDSEALLIQLFHDFLMSGQVDGVFEKLNNSKAFEKEGEINVFARASKSIIDTLAKHWTTSRGREIVLSVVSTQLVEKRQKHQKFLQFLALSKCHEELCSRQRQSLQIIMEHGEKLSGMIQLRELQNIISQSNETGRFSSGSDAQISGALWDLIQLVGETARRNTTILMDRDNAEVFYSKVSDIEQIFHCLEKQLQFLISEEMPILVQFQRACELANACATMFHAVIQYRSEHPLWYPPPEGLAPWYSKLVVRSGLWSITSFMLQLLNETNQLDDSTRWDFYSNLEVLSEVLLESYSNAITAKIERKEENRTLSEEYCKCRDTLLDSLYQHVKLFVEAKIQDSAEENMVHSKDSLAKVSSRLLSVAKKHEAYHTMWSICGDLDDSELLQTLMHGSVGPKGGFCCYVFKRLYDSKQFSKLIRLGEEFPQELAIFLKRHPDLLWLHEIYFHQFSSASETLHSLSLSKNDSSISIPEDLESNGSTCRLTLAKRKHFLNLARISTVAGRSADWETKVRRIEADLNILQIQEEILRLLPDDEERQSIGQKLLPPVDLIELCLKSQSRELSLQAFNIFAWTSASFLRNNTSLLEECWRNATNQDDWARLHHLSLTNGWSDETTSDTLKNTVLFQASTKCYGPGAEAFICRFDDVLPLRSETAELSSSKDSGSSVEAIIMQHNNFPDAGKLMLTAIMLGSDSGAAKPHPHSHSTG